MQYKIDLGRGHYPDQQLVIMLKDEGGNNITNEQDTEDTIINYYSKLFSSEHPRIPPNITSLQSIECSNIPTILELQDVIFSIGSSKAPADDGFHAMFYHHFWDSIKEDCYNTTKEISLLKSRPHYMNTSRHPHSKNC